MLFRKMKLLIQLMLTLALINISLSNNLKNKYLKRSVHINITEKDYKELNEKCINDLRNSSEFEECIDGYTKNNRITKDNYKKVCEIFNSDRCHHFIENPMKSLPNCKNTIINQILDESMIATIKSYMGIICQEDENRNICPMGELYISGSESKSNLTEVIQNTCKSKKCKDTTIKSLNSSLDSSKNAEDLSIVTGEVDKKEEENVKNMIMYLKSNECNALLKSNAFAIPTNAIINFIFSVIILLLFYFF